MKLHEVCGYVKLSNGVMISSNSKLYTQKKTLDDVEKERIIDVLKATEGQMTNTAELLGITRATLYAKVQRYKINRMCLLEDHRLEEIQE